MTQEELNLLKRMVDATKRQAEATERTADYLSTIAHVLQDGKIIFGKNTEN